jgi:membrane protease YdiL (CAAX protease family)
MGPEQAGLEQAGLEQTGQAAPPPLPDALYVYPPPPPLRPRPRTPNFADAVLFIVLMLVGLVVATGLAGVALHFHCFGLRDFADAQNKTWLVLATQLLVYLVGLAGAIPFFRTMWGEDYFAGLHWQWQTARRLALLLAGVAFLANVMAMLADAVLPSPPHAPIEKLFDSQTDAWMLAVFGVLVAPFFEEMIFRGFLLPATATAWDWAVEKSTGRGPRPLDPDGHPVWSRFAMVFAAVVVSVPFALMHSAQLAHAWGPLAVLYCVSLVLCTVRLVTRSLAASTLVHSAYNCMLFGIMFVETGGFRHMDKL